MKNHLYCDLEQHIKQENLQQFVGCINYVLCTANICVPSLFSIQIVRLCQLNFKHWNHICFVYQKDSWNGGGSARLLFCPRTVAGTEVQSHAGDLQKSFKIPTLPQILALKKSRLLDKNAQQGVVAWKAESSDNSKID
jgi:hypothetical protein